MATAFEDGMSFENPARVNVIVRGDDLLEFEQDGLGGGVSQFATVSQTLRLIALLAQAVDAALTPGVV